MKISQVSVSVHRIPVTLPLIDQPSGDGMRVVCEVETDDGRAVSAGEWIRRPDGLWALRITALPAEEG